MASLINLLMYCLSMSCYVGTSILCVHVSIFSGVNKELYGIVACNVDGRGLPLFLHMKLCNSTFLSGLIHKVRNIKCV